MIVPLALFWVPAGVLLAANQWPAGIARAIGLALFLAGMNLLLAT